MKSIVFDTSSIISLATNNLLWTFEPLKRQFNGNFYISESVHQEIFENPLRTKRYKLEAIMIQNLVDRDIIRVYDDKNAKNHALELLDILNHSFKTHDKYIKILDLAELESLVLCKSINASAYIVDERTIRLLVENHNLIGSILEEKIHTKIIVDKVRLRNIKDEFKDIKIIRSVELMLVAYNMGLFDKFITDKKKKYDLVDGMLWALKLHGCSITENEINQILKSDIL